MDIQKLIDKYYSGESSREEELALQHFFSQPDVPEEFAAEKAFFQALHTPEMLVPAHLEARLKRQTEGWQRLENTFTQRTRKNFIKWVSATAACLVLVGGIASLWLHKEENPAMPRSDYVAQKDTYKTPEEAGKAAHEALKIFSEALNANHAQ